MTHSPHDPEVKIFTNKLHELAERALQTQEPQWTDFLDPSQRDQVQAVLSWSSGVRHLSFGGYSQSERRRVVIFPDYYISESIQPLLSFLEVTATGTGLDHRDFLGAILSLGIKREKIGDLIVTPDSRCQFVLLPELTGFVRSNLTKVGNQHVTVTEIEAEQLTPATLREKLIRTTVASLRLDAVAAFGFGESRTKMAREIKAERLKLNWRVVNDPDLQVKPGDIISMRGRGRLVFQEQTGQSKKGRYGILLIRYL